LATQHGGTNWYAVIDERDADGKRKRRWLSLHTTSKRKAEQELAKILAQQAQGALPPAGKTTVADVISAYIESRKVAGRAPKTIISYQSLADTRLLPALGRIPATQLTPQQIERFYAAQLSSERLDERKNSGDHISPTTVRRLHALLRGAFTHALHQGVVVRNPADAVTPPRPAKKEPKALPADTVVALLEAAEGHRLARLLRLAVTTALREGELIGLRWADVDLENRRLYVRVQRQYLPGEGIVERETKEHRGTRPIDLTEDEVGLLSAQRAQVAAERLHLGEAWQDHDLVFPSAVGTPIGQRNLLRWFDDLVEAAGIPDVRFHDLRHTAGTHLMAAGRGVIPAQHRLGHSRPSTTLDLYGHALPGHQAAAAEAVQATLREAAAKRKAKREAKG
jgi:integrase